MKCPKCGHELEEGNLYCEVCGEEVYIVPAFEPEIENSISDVLSDVADQIAPQTDTKPEQDDEIDVSGLDDSQGIHEEKSAGSDVVVIPKKLLVGICIAVVALIIACVGVMSYYLFRDNSYDYQIRNGDKSYEAADYTAALRYYEKAFTLNSEDMEALYKIGEVYKSQENYPKAEEIYGKIVGYRYEKRALEELINVYIHEEKYAEINAVLLKYADEETQLEYIDYMAKEPTFSVEEGTYDDVTLLELIPSTEGSIYYTLDGSEPGSDCMLYTEPIILKNGKYIVNAVFVNSKGICSQIASHTYMINSDVPDVPVVSPADGVYNVPQLITVEVPVGANVYYTTDDTVPTTASAIYTDPIAIPQGDSVYHFIAVSPQGNSSDEIVCRYTLDVETVVTQEQAIEIVKNRQFEVGRVISPDGSVEGSEGKYMYTYSGLRYVQNRTLYFVSEYYQEGTIRMTTGNIFAVDVFDGHIYQAIAGSNNSYSLRDF